MTLQAFVAQVQIPLDIGYGILPSQTQSASVGGPEFAMDNARFRNYCVIHPAILDPDMNKGN